MRFTKLYLIIIAITLFISGCNTAGTDEATYTEPYPNDVADSEIVSGENTYWAKDNLDLQRVGNLLEQADDAEEFEYLLNSDDGINNLDLNGDGYVDYISVSEYEDQYDDQRGFSLFSMFGPDEIQEIARIIFDRSGYDYYDYPGARVLVTGNEQIYGDDYYYETNWLDKSLAIANWVFSNRDGYYESPYYYNNYPDYYEPYRVVETPVYVTRIQEYYPEPIFVRTYEPIVTNIKIKSKYKDKSIDKIYAKLAKPTREQINFKQNNPNRPEFVPVKRGKVKDVPPKFNKIRERNRNNFEKPGKGNNKNFEARNKPNKVERQNVKPNKPDKVDRRNEKPNKVERQMQKPNKPNKADKPGKGNDKRGGGNTKGNGGGKNKGGGKGKGKG